ncbi:MAG: hypothetical protein ACI38Q_08085 [Candidatus Bruticola sp.]
MKRLSVLIMLSIICCLVSGCQKYDVDRDVLPPGTPYTREENSSSIMLSIYPDRIEKSFEGKFTEGKGLYFINECFVKVANFSDDVWYVWIEGEGAFKGVYPGAENIGFQGGVVAKMMLMLGERRVLRVPIRPSFDIVCQSNKSTVRERWNIKDLGAPKKRLGTGVVFRLD